MPQSFKQKCDYWWRGSVRPHLGLARLPNKLSYRRLNCRKRQSLIYLRRPLWLCISVDGDQFAATSSQVRFSGCSQARRC